jgi:hypothetical protein
MKSIHFRYLLILLIVIISACEDDPVSNQADHFKAIGTVIYDATGALSVSILRGVTTDTLYINEGVLSDHFEVKFYDDEENIIEAPTNGSAILDHSIQDTSLISWWQHPGEEGGFEFHLRGLKKGITVLELFIKHEDHNDYRSGGIPVRVK